jgi:hypothetical protein
MEVRNDFFRLVVGLSAFALGIGVYFIWQSSPAETVTAVPNTVKPFAESSPIFVPLPPPLETAVENEAEPADEFYPDGSFYPDGELPKAFKDIEVLMIEATDWYDEKDNYKPKPMLVKGSLHTKNQFKFAKISINNRLISFETTTVKGIKYTFVGEYQKNPESSENDGIDLKGMLKKFKDGKEIGSSKMGFYASGC